MKSRITVLVLAVALLAAGAGCQLFNPVTQDDAAEAFGVAFGAYIVNVLVLVFGGEVEGATYDETSGTMTFTSYDLTELGTGTDYTSMSGTIAESSGDLVGDLTLRGGIVRDLQFTIDAYDDGSDIASVTVVANGKTFVLTDFSLQ